MLDSLKYTVTSVKLDDLGIFIIVILSLIALVFINWLLLMIGKAMLAKKAGEKAWKIFIPIYSSYMICKISGTNFLWVILQVVSTLVYLSDSRFYIIYIIVNFMYAYVVAANLCHSFGKANGFLIGLLLLPNIFYFIFGLTKNEYLGPIGDADPIFKNVSFGKTRMDRDIEKETMEKLEKYKNVKNNTKRDDNYQFCYGCGYKISEYDRFCPGCGREL